MMKHRGFSSPNKSPADLASHPIASANLEREGRLPAQKTSGGVRLFDLETVERFAVERKRRAGAGEAVR